MSEPFDFERYAVHKARKAYHCSECDAGIEAGELYVYMQGYLAGDGYIYRTCLPCAECAADLSAEIGEAIPFESLQEWLHEECLEARRRLIAGIRASFKVF